MADILDFDAIQLSVASPSTIKNWSHGEVTKPETINYRTLRPEKNGLFCEKIFGPTKDWECYCGKYKRIRYKGIICDKCGVEVTQSKVRRERMAHIGLAAPVAHAWFMRGTPSVLALLLDLSPRSMDAVIYFSSYIIISVNEEKKAEVVEQLSGKLEGRRSELRDKTEEQITKLEEELKERLGALKSDELKKEAKELSKTELELKTRQKVQQLRTELEKEEGRLEEVYKTVNEMVNTIKPHTLLSEDEYYKLMEYDASEFLDVGMGAEAVYSILGQIDLGKLSSALREESIKTTGQRHIKAGKRLRIVEGMRAAKIDPQWMILQVLPVLPPELRPMVQLSGGRFATSDLNDLYRRVINRNNRLKRLIDLGAPSIILRNEKRMLQEAVDALIDSSRKTTSRLSAQAETKSLTDMLQGKQGRFRQNLLGKRVDYSGRSVIIVGPELKLNQMGLPKEMALEMFKPFVLHELIVRGFAPNVKSAKHVLERRSGEVWDILEEITKNHPVLLNRAPTLHKLGIQAFFPILVEGNAIKIHPCVCTGYNADFDGDQMAVHIPLSQKARDEAIELMLASKNLLLPSNGTPVTLPNREMSLGSYFLTYTLDEKPKDDKVFADFEEAIYANQAGKLSLQTMINVRYEGKMMQTTVGRVLFNEVVPKNIGFVNTIVEGKLIRNLVTQAYETCENETVRQFIDDLKMLGFKYADMAGISIGIVDCVIHPDRDSVIEEADERVAEIDSSYKNGLITRDEMRSISNDIWIETTEKVQKMTWDFMEFLNPLKMVVEAGARGSKDQVKQLQGMRGLVADPSGRIVELPTKSNFRQGLMVFEYFTSSRGSRKGFADRALRTSASGYLTRRLVDVAHDVIIRELDCHAINGFSVTRKEFGRHFKERLISRLMSEDIIDPKTKKVIVEANTLVDERMAETIDEAGIDKVMVRSPLTCQTKFGMCQACYGWDMSSKKIVTLGTPVGVIAAQSIGEPGTQLTMRTFHTGGVIGLDITQGLPRVEELVEARTPKNPVPIADISGKVEIFETSDNIVVRIKDENVKPVEEREYVLPLTADLKVEDGAMVNIGTPLMSGHLDIKQILQVQGLQSAQKYLIAQAQDVYESQGIPIHDKHFEVIVRKMCDKVKVEAQGDTTLLPGELVERARFEAENAKVIAEGGEPSSAQIVMLGITKASLYTDSFLSAASFQETKNVLTEAAVLGKIDHLVGLKENVIIGRLIPTSPERATEMMHNQ
ncbi:MAG: DNA-directed RNA polymerase subunit beta' [bacterium]|nr:DNA-directed RNA polymerase subunit beta' [bacterium]